MVAGRDQIINFAAVNLDDSYDLAVEQLGEEARGSIDQPLMRMCCPCPTQWVCADRVGCVGITTGLLLILPQCLWI